MSEWKPLSGAPAPSAPEREPSGGSGLPLVIVGIVGCFGMVMFIGILAAIAIPNFLAMQLRAKRAEAPSNLDAIRYGLEAQNAAGLPVPSFGPCPPSDPGRNPRPFTGDCAEIMTLLGVDTAGQVRCSYQATTAPPSASGIVAFQAEAWCDVDGDGEYSRYSGTHLDRAKMVSPNNVY